MVVVETRLTTLKRLRKQIKTRIRHYLADYERRIAREQRVMLFKARRRAKRRQHFLVGRYYLERARRSGRMSEINKLMDGYLDNNEDRALFGLLDI